MSLVKVTSIRARMDVLVLLKLAMCKTLSILLSILILALLNAPNVQRNTTILTWLDAVVRQELVMKMLTSS